MIYWALQKVVSISLALPRSERRLLPDEPFIGKKLFRLLLSMFIAYTSLENILFFNFFHFNYFFSLFHLLLARVLILVLFSKIGYLYFYMFNDHLK